ncbi:hypothetical protein EV03_0842 [Prochlorococcus marinus str. PAC1]|uniref:Uncharacterized protein n=1 Tax=Prochlorococcus marinus str. PAC1 TaxID=59924 RepID=A0A0A2C7P0_PROMR|nr:hypothetical protein EV03_0842 [Prochlorococcus marinus str. PAC1]
MKFNYLQLSFKFEKWYELFPEMLNIFITLNPKRISNFLNS